MEKNNKKLEHDIINLLFLISLILAIVLIRHFLLNGFFPSYFWVIVIFGFIIGCVQSKKKQFIKSTISFLIISLLLFTATYNWVNPKFNYADDIILFDKLIKDSFVIEDIDYTANYYPFNKQKILIRIRLFNFKDNNTFELGFISTRNVTKINYLLNSQVQNSYNKTIHKVKDKKIILPKKNSLYFLNIEAESEGMEPKGYVTLVVDSENNTNIFEEKGTNIRMGIVLNGEYYICDNPCSWTDDKFSELQYKENSSKKIILKSDILINNPNKSKQMKSFAINTLYNYIFILRQVFLAMFTGLTILLTTEIYNYYRKTKNRIS